MADALPTTVVYALLLGRLRLRLEVLPPGNALYVGARAVRNMEDGSQKQ